MALRASLTYSLGCEPACDLVSPSFTVPLTEVPLGATMSAQNTTSGADSYIWRLNSEILSTDTNLINYTFNIPGIFQLCLDAIKDTCVNRFCEKLVVYPICNLSEDTCELVINGDFEQIINPVFHPEDFTQVCGWDSLFSTPYFCSAENSFISLWINSNYLEEFDTFDIERVQSELPLDLDTGIIYDISFDYLVGNHTPEAFLIALSSDTTSGPLPSSSNVIAKIDYPAVDIPFIGNNSCFSNIAFNSYSSQFIYEGDEKLYLDITGIPDSVFYTDFPSIVFIDNLSIRKCTFYECLPDPDFTYELDSCQLSLEGKNFGDPGSYNWNFGDGTSDTGQYVTHQYIFGGTFNVCLTIECSEFDAQIECKDVIIPAYCEDCEELPSITAMKDCDFDSTATEKSYMTMFEFEVPTGDCFLWWRKFVHIFPRCECLSK